jgi:hypothetical protein
MQVRSKVLKLEKMGRIYKIWISRHANALHPATSIDDDKNVPIARFINGIGLLNNENILYGGLQVENEKNIPDKDLEDTRTSLVALAKAVATEERNKVANNVLHSNLICPLHKQHHVLKYKCPTNGFINGLDIGQCHSPSTPCYQCQTKHLHYSHSTHVYKRPCKKNIHASLESNSTYCSVLYLYEGEVQNPLSVQHES